MALFLFQDWSDCWCPYRLSAKVRAQQGYKVQASVIAVYHGIEVLSAPHFAPGMIRSLGNGRYERGEIKTALASVRPGDRILEMGAGSGVVGAVIAKNCSPSAVLSVEANGHLIPHISELYRHNSLAETISVRHCVVLSQDDAPEEIGFRVRGNFLGSRLATNEPERGALELVKVARYKDLKAEFPHNVLIMDIEGAELEFLRGADLSGLDLVVFEVHRNVYGREGMREIRRTLARKGFSIDDEISEAGVHVYRTAVRRREEAGTTSEAVAD